MIEQIDMREKNNINYTEFIAAAVHLQNDLIE
jgi:hypothetical protein